MKAFRQRRPIIYLLPAIGLIASVPWLLPDFSPEKSFGFPPWALYVLLPTSCYAVLVFFSLRRSQSGNSHTPEEKEDEIILARKQSHRRVNE